MDNWITGTAIYVVIWWLVLFMTLPFGVRRPEEHELEPGQEPGAPVKPMMWRKMAVCTLISAVIWLVFYFVADAGLISFRPE